MDYQVHHMTDENLYPFSTGVEDGIPIIEWAKRRDFPKWLRKSKYCQFLGWGIGNNWRCFVSDVQCYAVRDLNVHARQSRTTWVLTVDHLVPSKINNTKNYHRLTNQTFVGSWLNNLMGHNPLALKLLHRNNLKTKEYDRNDVLSVDTYYTVKKHIIDLENSLSFHGKYPWQPWSYDNNDHRIAAEDFMKKICALDAEFIHLERHQRSSWLDSFVWNY